LEERYEIETVEQLRAIADLLRLRIIEALDKRAMTVTQVGEELGVAPAKIHYHVRELERVGLLKLVETREKGGILEKYYQPVAHEIGVSKALFSAYRDESDAMLRTLLNQLVDGYIQAFRHAATSSSPERNTAMSLLLSQLYMTREEQRKLIEQFDELSRVFAQRRGIEGEREIIFSALLYPPEAPAVEQKEEVIPAQANWAVGVVNYSRNDLLQARAAGKRLRINVIGICHFASNIDAALADEVIESFTLVGKLTAPAEVKEVLQRKGGREEDKG
jgi:predicted transcriptional regulator